VHFGFDDDQLALREAVAGLLDKKVTIAYLQDAWRDPSAPEVWAVWQDLCDMGVHGLMAPEAAGGSGMDWTAMALVLAEAGRVALPLPILETAAVAVPLLVGSADPLGVLPAVLRGEAVVTVAGAGAAPVPVPGSSRADWFVLDERLYSRGEVELTPVGSVDRTRDTALAVPVGPGTPVGTAGELGALATAAVLVGIGRALVQMTVDYVKDRKQFGVPVGSFQAVKHHLADATMHVEFAAPAVWAAAYEMSQPTIGEPQRRRSVSLAKAMASDAAERAARTALQCHGAMGYTDDYHLHFWLKRVWCLSPSFGSARQHRVRLGRQLGLPVGLDHQERSA
jgi:alkylation response protein AidB-like acyl-CoA dehydrogenase